MEGTRIKSQNLEKELKELKQQIFKAKVGEHKEERRIFRGKLDELKATIQEVESLISISRINEAKNKIQICLDTLQEYKLNKNYTEAISSK